MKKNFMRAISLVMVLVIMVASFAGCGEGTEVKRPEAVSVKTDLKDVYFTFTYGELKDILPGDKLATLFENTNKKLDSREIEISYYELVSKYGGQEYFPELLNLISDEEKNAFVANQQDVLDYFNEKLNEIKTTGVARVSYYEDFWINHGDGVVFKDLEGNELDGQDKFKAAFRLYSDMGLKDIGKYLMNISNEEKYQVKEGDKDKLVATDFKEDLTNIIYPIGQKNASTLTLDDLYTDIDKETGIVTQPVYTSVVPTFVYDLDDKGNNAKYTEGELEGEYIFVPSELYRTINIAVKPELASVEKAFTIREKDGIFKEFEKASNYLIVNSFDIAFTPCKISAAFNAVNDQMTYATFEKNMIITANVTFKGALAEYGTVIVEFPCTSSLTYNFGWETTAE
ncbi:MAG: hypothetical protein IKB36_00245 [Clostridia bacterium]|nr:hypothetical protein [Clostridia bacterium]